MTTTTNGREKIISAAKTLFVKNGFNGTSLRDIAKTAQVPVSLIYHYFSNKADLWKEAKLLSITESGWLQNESLLQADNLAVFIDRLIDCRLELLNKNADILRFFDWQRLEDKNEQLAGIGTTSAKGKWATLFEHLQHFRQIGQLPNHLSNEEIAALILGVISGPFIRTGKSIFTTEQQQKNYAATVKSMLLHTLNSPK